MNQNPRCAVAVKPVMSVFEIAVKGEELLLAEWNYNSRFHALTTDASQRGRGTPRNRVILCEDVF